MERSEREGNLRYLNRHLRVMRRIVSVPAHTRASRKVALSWTFVPLHSRSVALRTGLSLVVV